MSSPSSASRAAQHPLDADALITIGMHLLAQLAEVEGNLAARRLAEVTERACLGAP